MEVCWERGGEGEGALLLPMEVEGGGSTTRECTMSWGREEGRRDRDPEDLEEDREASQPSPVSSQGEENSHQGGEGGSSSPLQLTPVLIESQIQRIADTALALVKSLPDLEPKHPHLKKKICKELEVSYRFTIVQCAMQCNVAEPVRAGLFCVAPEPKFEGGSSNGSTQKMLKK